MQTGKSPILENETSNNTGVLGCDGANVLSLVINAEDTPTGILSLDISADGNDWAEIYSETFSGGIASSGVAMQVDGPWSFIRGVTSEVTNGTFSVSCIYGT